jgi:hypothetical protein
MARLQLSFFLRFASCTSTYIPNVLFFPVWLVTCLSFHISSDVSAIFGWFAAVVPLPTNNTALMGASRRGRS